MTTAFVLSGGGNLGAVQVGMLQALADRGVVPDLLVGTSVGAISAAFLAAGPSPARVDALAEIWSRTKRRDIFPTSPLSAMRAMSGRAISVAGDLGADVVYVLPTGYACALPHPPASALGMALHAVSLAIQRRLVADVGVWQDRCTLRVVPPLCPVSVWPTDFGHTVELIERARTSTRNWLDRPLPFDQTTYLGYHEHAPDKVDVRLKY